ncbi:MAG: GDSL-type esterase/lipase family protein [Candidatus Zixiibacteriota bacterium]
MLRLFKYIAFNLVILIVAFGLCETVLRIANVNPRVDNPFFLLVRVFEYPDYFKKDTSLFWRLRSGIREGTEFLVPGSYRTNSLGLRGPEALVDSDGSQVRVACFGNSCTFGWRLEEADTYPMQIQSLLSLSQSGLEPVAFNCGVPGYSSFQGRKFLQEYFPILKPQYVTLCYGWNDHWAAGFDIEDKKQQMSPQCVLDIQNTASKSYVYRAVKYALLSSSEKSREYTYNRQSPTYRVSLDDYRDNLRDMVNYCLTHNAKPIIITAPVADVDPGKDNSMETYHLLYAQIGVMVGQEMSVPVVDAAAMFAQHPEFWDDPKADFIHYNSRGAEFIADQVAKIIAADLGPRNPGSHK